MKRPFGRIWDFETPNQSKFKRFLIVLKLFDIQSLEESCGPCDICSCKFYCTKRDRERIEAVYRRFIGLIPSVRTELSMWEEGYEIY